MPTIKEPTATPRRIQYEMGHSGVGAIVDAEGFTVLNVSRLSTLTEGGDMEEFLSELVKRYNAHAGLVAALVALLEMPESDGSIISAGKRRNAKRAAHTIIKQLETYGGPTL